MNLLIVRVVFACIALTAVSSAAQPRIEAWIDFDKGLLWLASFDSDFLLVTLPGSSIDVGKRLEEGALRFDRRMHRETWLYTLPSMHSPTKAEAITLTGVGKDLLEQRESLNIFALVRRVRPLNGESKILGDAILAKIPTRSVHVERLPDGAWHFIPGSK